MIASPATTGIVDQQAERDDERRDRHLLDVDAERRCIMPNVIASVMRDRQRHQQRRAPLPEPDERDEHDQHDGFLQAAAEEVQLLAHLTLLIGRRADDEIGRK